MKFLCSPTFSLIITFLTRQCSTTDVLVKISSGTLRGNTQETWTQNKYFSFKGIPYAEPPIGNLRFKAPVTVKPWSGIKNSIKDGNACPQSNVKFLGEPTDEDCLYLNVYTKMLKGNQPVIVWVHPSGFVVGTGNSNWFGPDYLLDHDIVLVTFNHRLNALGFLSNGNESAIGNYGLKDQVEALKWVQKNIIKFGGNPQQVTLAGDSAGSASALLHMLSPMSKGLFHKVIGMSGGIAGTIKWIDSRDQTEGTKKLSQLLNCPIKPVVDMIECLKNVPANAITNKFEEFEEIGKRNLLKFGPVIEPDLENGEDRFLINDPITLLKKRAFQSVPVATGLTENEFIRKGIVIVKNNSFLKELNNEFYKLVPSMLEYDDKNCTDIKKITDSLRKFYFGNHVIGNYSVEALGKMFSDFGINYGEYATAKILSQFGENPIYFYKFSYKGRYGNEHDPVTNKTLGPGHTDDIQYLFYQSRLYPKFKESDPEAFMVKRMTSLWYNFASKGNPTPDDSPVQWRPVTDKKYLNINESLALENNFPFFDRMQFWESLFPQ